MKICYFDESGCLGKLPKKPSDIQPVFTLAGCVFDTKYSRYLAQDFLSLKRRFHPKKLPKDASSLEWVLAEIKGADIRRQICSSKRNERRHGITFLTEILNLIEKYDGKILGSIYVKGQGDEFHSTPVYTSAVHRMYSEFQEYLIQSEDIGFMVGDARKKDQNSIVAHGIFTRKHRAAGDPLDRILEIPTFAHARNSVPLQISDLVNSAFLFPLAVNRFCQGHLSSLHCRGDYKSLLKFLPRIKELQFRYKDGDRHQGGLYINNRLNKRPIYSFFYQGNLSSEIPLDKDKKALGRRLGQIQKRK